MLWSLGNLIFSFSKPPSKRRDFALGILNIDTSTCRRRGWPGAPPCFNQHSGHRALDGHAVIPFHPQAYGGGHRRALRRILQDGLSTTLSSDPGSVGSLRLALSLGCGTLSGCCCVLRGSAATLESFTIPRAAESTGYWVERAHPRWWQQHPAPGPASTHPSASW